MAFLIVGLILSFVLIGVGLWYSLGTIIKMALHRGRTHGRITKILLADANDPFPSYDFEYEVNGKWYQKHLLQEPFEDISSDDEIEVGYDPSDPPKSFNADNTADKIILGCLSLAFGLFLLKHMIALF